MLNSRNSKYEVTHCRNTKVQNIKKICIVSLENLRNTGKCIDCHSDLALFVSPKFKSQF